MSDAAKIGSIDVPHGSRLVFYNDHAGDADMNMWKQLATELPYYRHVHGVIFHGDPFTINPDNEAFTSRSEKIFQLFADGQGETGSCVGWALGDSDLRWRMVRAGRLGRSQLISPRFIWMAARETDEFNDRPTTFIEEEGTSLKSALDIVRKPGAVPDAVLAFMTGRMYAGDEKTFYAIATGMTISSYFNLGKDPAKRRAWIAARGPILAALDVDRSWMDCHRTAGRLETYRPASEPGGHAVAIVGYTPEYFIVRNSWGVAFGDKVFAYASLPYMHDAFHEAYGVVL